MRTVVFILIAIPLCVKAQMVEGVVLRIIDGDTFEMRASVIHECEDLDVPADSILVVRIKGIDAPERDQLYGDSAKLVLSRLLPLGMPCVANSLSHDKYPSRFDAHVWSEAHWGDPLNVDLDSLKQYMSLDSCIAFKLLRLGFAWCYDCVDYSAAKMAENDAHWAARGLWAQDAPYTTPWEWRKMSKAEKAAAKRSASSTPAPSE